MIDLKGKPSTEYAISCYFGYADRMRLDIGPCAYYIRVVALRTELATCLCSNPTLNTTQSYFAHELKSISYRTPYTYRAHAPFRHATLLCTDVQRVCPRPPRDGWHKIYAVSMLRQDSVLRSSSDNSVRVAFEKFRPRCNQPLNSIASLTVAMPVTSLLASYLHTLHALLRTHSNFSPPSLEITPIRWCIKICWNSLFG